MQSLLRPGVTLEHGDAARVPPVVLRTDVAALVGIAERGPLDTPLPVESMRQFHAHFGGFVEGGYLAWAARGFFENGGRRLWVVRVAHRGFGDDGTEAPNTARAASADLADAAGTPALRLAASSPGGWGNTLTLQWLASGAVVTAGRAVDAGRATVAGSVAGFGEADLVRIEQGPVVLHRVVARLDADTRTLHWIHPDAALRRPGHRALSGIDPAQPLRLVRVAYGLVVRERGEVVASHADLHAVPWHPRWIGAVLRLPPAPAGTGTADVPRPPPPVVALPFGDAGEPPLPLAVVPGQTLPLAGGSDGLADLLADEFVGEEAAPADSDFVRRRKTRGLRALAAIDEIALVAMPDLLIRPAPLPGRWLPEPPPPDPCTGCPPPAPPRRAPLAPVAGEVPGPFADEDVARVQSALVALAEAAGDRFVLLGVPQPLALPERSRSDTIAWRARFDSRVAALYAPWLRVADPRPGGTTRLVPGCGHVLGVIAATDLAEGVQRAPAIRTLADVVGLSRAVDDPTHALWNEAAVNTLRVERAPGAALCGARTLSHDASYRFINVVRLILTIRKACDVALRWTVSEPHDAALRAQIEATLLAILRLFHAQGAFAGDSEATSFYARCDESLNPPAERDHGRLVAEVGIAPAAPAEFIVLRVGRQAGTRQLELYARSGET
ncbi:phage tail sheath C-terminal domain-containing protein [Aquincola sp. MAHUQ-54]|uniref:Phage tail sheath C-terminal domain-containing protein n=1 Tax=Aquincola agrisoli TaxID=3119538 RepID=A0AAW9QGI8_9BURK